MESFICTIKEGTPTDRLDKTLHAQVPEYSRTYFQDLIQEKQVLVNGIAMTKPSWPIRAGDSLEVFFPAVRQVGALPIPSEDMGVFILYEHADFLIVVKPAGLVVHRPHSRSTEVTLVDWLVHTCKELSTVGPAERPGIVHRLDKDTSGLMIIPRTNQSHAYFSELFQKRSIEKTYLAYVIGQPPQQGTVDHPIGRDPMQPHKMAHVASGRSALSQYKVLTYFPSTALLEVKPYTGRTHQIRVHLASEGYPLVGDKVYGTEDGRIARHALHAYRLSFTYKEQWYSFICSMPRDMQHLEKQIAI